MARRPILEKWRASRGHLSPQKPKLPWSYLVLAHLSVGYPGLEGRLPTCYSPVRRCTQGVAPLFSLDLHVLGTPPAFVLSQDQTLQLKLENPMSDHRERYDFERTVDPTSTTRAARIRPQLLPPDDEASSGLPLPSFQRPMPKNR